MPQQPPKWPGFRRTSLAFLLGLCFLGGIVNLFYLVSGYNYGEVNRDNSVVTEQQLLADKPMAAGDNPGSTNEKDGVATDDTKTAVPVILHRGMAVLQGQEKQSHLSNVLLCRNYTTNGDNSAPVLNLFYNTAKKGRHINNEWTTDRCWDLVEVQNPNTNNHQWNPNVQSVASLLAQPQNSQWANCAQQQALDPRTKKALLLRDEVKGLVRPPPDLSLSCPSDYWSYPTPPQTNAGNTTTTSTTILLQNPIHCFQPNVFHAFVIGGRDIESDHEDVPGEWGGKQVWCFLDAIAKFGLQQHQQNAHAHAHAPPQQVQWQVEYNIGANQKSNNYVKELLGLLGHYDNLQHVPPKQEHMIPYKLKLEDCRQNNLGGVLSSLLARMRPRCTPRNGHVIPWMHFLPKDTPPNDYLIDIAVRVRKLVLANHPTLNDDDDNNNKNNNNNDKQQQPFVLLILRSNSTFRRFAGSQSGTVTEVVLALLEKSLPIRIMDLEYASVRDQIEWFSQATVVIGMHGAGLTNLIWMAQSQQHQHSRSTLIEIACSYGWPMYVDTSGTCRSKTDEPLGYKKADFHNLALVFGVRHILIHPTYATPPPPDPNHNPISKEVFYVDAQALAEVAQREFLSHTDNNYPQ